MIFKKCEDLHISAVRTNLHVIKLVNYGRLICQLICLSLNLFNQTEPENKEAKILEESMQVHDSFESTTVFVNLSLQLLDCSPLKSLKPNTTVKLGKKK